MARAIRKKKVDGEGKERLQLRETSLLGGCKRKALNSGPANKPTKQ